MTAAHVAGFSLGAPSKITGLTWIVERTFAWIGRNRRLSKDYEDRVQTSETMIDIASIRLMLNRLAKNARHFLRQRTLRQGERMRADRVHARFVNNAMMITLLGATVSDALADGRVVSGVGRAV